MAKFESTGRVVLDDKATSLLKERYSALKSEGAYYQLSYSKLASWIVSRYIDAYYDKEVNLIRKAHFSPKGYMRSLLDGCENEQDLRSAMQDTLKMMKSRKKCSTKNLRSEPDSPK